MTYLKRYPIKRASVDAGYESEENYCSFEENNDTELYLKPGNHDQNKRKKYRTDISRRENMAYDADTDTYTCVNGKPITFDGVKKSKSPNGFETETAVYSCKDCDGCALKKLIRVNRSIQAEGVFAMTKEDMRFRRFLLRSAGKVEVEWTTLSLAYNVLKLFHKNKAGRLGTGLVVPEGFPAGI